MRSRIIDIIERQADTPFLIAAATGREITFAQFHSLATHLAQLLRSKGIAKGDRVAVILENSPEFAILYFACIYIGAVIVPVNPALHMDDIGFILECSAPVILINSPATTSLLPRRFTSDAQLSTICITNSPDVTGEIPANHTIWSSTTANTDHNGPDLPSEIEASDLAVVMFTSGTTGTPKGVSHRVGSLMDSAGAFNAALNFGPDNRFYHILAMSYMAGFLNNLLCPFLAGGSIVIDRAFDAQLVLGFWRNPIKHGVNTMWLVPTILSMLLKMDRSTDGENYCRKHIDTVCVGTAPLPPTVQDDFQRRYGVELLESYGLSETLFVSTNSLHSPRRRGSVGRPLPDVAIGIVDDHGNGMPPGEDGEIVIRSGFVMSGYFDSRTRLPTPLVDSWFCSGDVGHMSEDGNLYITGRKKDLIIRGGVNISPRVIETVLLTHADVYAAAVVSLPDAFYGEKIVAVVELKPAVALHAVRAHLIEQCKSRLAPIAVPTEFHQVQTMPTSVTGKTNRAELRRIIAEDDQ